MEKLIHAFFFVKLRPKKEHLYMLSLHKFTLDNGLKIIVQYNPADAFSTLNILYNVGAKNELASKTGFAHLFEHLMFGGSINVPEFDTHLEMAGGKNNAFTSNDLTNYYDIMPSQNIETAFWLESDRMLSLAFDPESLEVQRKVVCEEFKEHYINKPYGDTSHLIRNLAYQTHPYKWPTIGLSLQHVQDATLADVKDFFAKHYGPNNAVLTVCGNTSPEQVLELANKYFANIAPINLSNPSYEVEPKQTELRRLEVSRNVSANALYMAFHGVSRTHAQYYTMDLLTDVLSVGYTSMFNEILVKEKKLFSSISCYHYGSNDPGLIQISGKLMPNIDFKLAEDAIWQILETMKTDLIENDVFTKIQNKTEVSHKYELIDQAELAFQLSYYEMFFNDAAYLEENLANYQKVTPQDIRQFAQDYLVKENCNIIYYKKSNKE